jgi:hypothetical protein
VLLGPGAATSPHPVSAATTVPATTSERTA